MSEISDLDNILTVDLANELISARQFQKLIDELWRFQDLPFQVAEALIQQGFGWDVADDITSFAKSDHQKICNELVDFDYCHAILINLDDFHEIDQVDLIKRLIQKGQGNFPLFILDHFDQLNSFQRLEIAREFHRNGYGNDLEEYGILLNKLEVTPLDYGKRGGIDLRAHLLNSSRVQYSDQGPPVLDEEVQLSIILGDEIIAEASPDKTVDHALRRTANGFESWKNKSRIAKGSMQSDLVTAIKEISQISMALS